MATPMTDILKKADETKHLQGLIELWNEIADNKKQYPLAEIWDANKHIGSLALRSDGEDMQKVDFFTALYYQVPLDKRI